MKRLIYIILLLIVTVSVKGQVNLLSGNLQITGFPSSLPSSKFLVSGNFNDTKGLFYASDITTGMWMWKGNSYYVIDSIYSVAGTAITFRVTDPNATGFISGGSAGIMELSTDGIPASPPTGDSNSSLMTPSDYSALMSFISQLVGGDTSSTNEVQVLSISNDTISLSMDGSVKLPLVVVSKAFTSSGSDISNDTTTAWYGQGKVIALYTRLTTGASSNLVVNMNTPASSDLGKMFVVTSDDEDATYAIQLAGLNRFDGVDSTTYTMIHGESVIFQAQETDAGNRWVAVSASIGRIRRVVSDSIAAFSPISALDDLSDVVITAASNGQVLKFNGTNWVNGVDETGAADLSITGSTPTFTINSSSGTDVYINKGNGIVMSESGDTLFVSADTSVLVSKTFLTNSLPADSINITQDSIVRLLSGSTELSRDTITRLAQLLNAAIGTGTTNYLAKFTGTSAIGNSLIQDDGAKVTVGGKLDIQSGTFSNPGLRLANDTTAGIYQVNPKTIGLISDSSGLLVGKKLTNLMAPSERFEVWSAQNILSVTNGFSAPDGSLNARLVVPNTTSAQHRIYLAGPTSATFNFSVFVKAAGYNYVSLGIGGGVNGGNVIFSLADGSISGTTAGLTFASIAYPNGWYRVSFFGNNTIYTNFFLIVRNANSTSDYAGDGTSGIYVFGAQLTEGSELGPYIKTGGAIETSENGVSFLTKGTFIAGINANRVSSGGDNSLYFNTSGTDRMEIDSAGRVKLSILTPTPTRLVGADASGFLGDVSAMTTSIKIPTGTTVQRSATPATGDVRYNTTLGSLEWYGTSAYESPVKSTSTTGLGTAGRVFYADANGRAAADDALYWDATNNRLGVGVASPARSLDVGEMRVNDLSTDTPTRLVGADGDGDFNEVTSTSKFITSDYLADASITSAKLAATALDNYIKLSEDSFNMADDNQFTLVGSTQLAGAPLDYAYGFLVPYRGTTADANWQMAGLATGSDALRMWIRAESILGSTNWRRIGIWKDGEDAGSVDVSASGDDVTFTQDTNSVNTIAIADNAVTLAKVQTISTNRLLGNDSGSSAAPSQLVVGNGVQLSNGSVRLGGHRVYSTSTSATVTSEIDSCGQLVVLAAIASGASADLTITLPNASSSYLGREVLVYADDKDDDGTGGVDYNVIVTTTSGTYLYYGNGESALGLNASYEIDPPATPTYVKLICVIDTSLAYKWVVLSY